VHIGSCDFSLKEYNFDNIAGDYSMSYFDTEVTHDNAQMIPFMRMAIDASKTSSKSEMGVKTSRGSANGVNILASPWSPPPWMKTPVKGVQNMTGSSVPHGLMDDPKIKAAYALYLSKFITAYEEKGIVFFVPFFTYDCTSCSDFTYGI
jgi:glucosylceramidase